MGNSPFNSKLSPFVLLLSQIHWHISCNCFYNKIILIEAHFPNSLAKSAPRVDSLEVCRKCTFNLMKCGFGQHSAVQTLRLCAHTWSLQVFGSPEHWTQPPCVWLKKSICAQWTRRINEKVKLQSVHRIILRLCFTFLYTYHYNCNMKIVDAFCILLNCIWF